MKQKCEHAGPGASQAACCQQQNFEPAGPITPLLADETLDGHSRLIPEAKQAREIMQSAPTWILCLKVGQAKSEQARKAFEEICFR